MAAFVDSLKHSGGALNDIWRWLSASGGAVATTPDAEECAAVGMRPRLGEIILRSGFAHAEVWRWCNDADRREAPA